MISAPAQINPKLVNQLLASKQSEAKSHPPHDENSLCPDCRMKRILWDTKLTKLANALMAQIIVDYQKTKEPLLSIEMNLLDALIMGFILGKQYVETLQLEETIR